MDTTASAKIIQRKFPTPMSARPYQAGTAKLFNENFVDSYPRNLNSAKLKHYTVLIKIGGDCTRAYMSVTDKWMWKFEIADVSAGVQVLLWIILQSRFVVFHEPGQQDDSKPALKLYRHQQFQLFISIYQVIDRILQNLECTLWTAQWTGPWWKSWQLGSPVIRGIHWTAGKGC